ncbi:uncharacterized protein LOC111334414 [Stylophora pistillata]|uniref:uncharacterized protein LOC111334414 n=1 Tax=Stylophora pistillata TaxID=50429 RepID=UPI000C03A99C|nr:uncharacterized protein LOC111334414 [Stylophora pistillata]
MKSQYNWMDLSRQHFSLSFLLSSRDLSYRIPIDNSVDKSRTHANWFQQRRAESRKNASNKTLTQSTAYKNGVLFSCCLRINLSLCWPRLSENTFFLSGNRICS